MDQLRTGHTVRFELGDVFCPPGEDALRRIIEVLLGTIFTGRVAFVADAGEDLGRYAAIDVEGIPRRLIVAVDRLREVPVAAETACVAAAHDD